MTSKTEFSSDMDAINIALELEGRAYNLYRKSSEKAEDSNASIIFQSMMEQEKKHIKYLMDLKSTLVKKASAH
jgi:rubrerythrin